MNITLSRPITYKDTQLDSLTLDLDSLTGNDLVAAEDALKRTAPDAPLYGTRHIACIAAKCAHIPAEVIMKLSAKDFMTVTTQVLSFFGSMDLVPQAPEVTDD